MTDLRPLSPLATVVGADPARVRAVRVLATDVDGTLTRKGVLGPDVLEALLALVQAGVEVLPVSGRSSGEVLGLCRYLPGVTEGLAENGFVAITPDRVPLRLGEFPDRAHLRRIAEEAARSCGTTLTLAPDEAFRVVDVAYEREGRSNEVLADLRAAVDAQGAGTVWSSVHFHVAPVVPDKGAALLTWCRSRGVDPLTVATVGDAPNDDGLFVPGRFGLTVGTADVAAQRHVFPHLPQAVTMQREADGFLQLARALLDARRT